MAEITFRQSVSATIPGASTAKGAPLTNLEMDGNFRSIQADLNTKVSASQLTAATNTSVDTALALAIALG